MSATIKKLEPYLKAAWITAVIAMAIFYVRGHENGVASSLRATSYLALCLSGVLVLGGKLLVCFQMALSLRQVGHGMTRLDRFRIYSYSDISKYLPGGFWAIAGRLAFYRNRGLSTRDLMAAFSLEHVWLIGSALAVGGILYLLGLMAYAEPVFGLSAVAVRWGSLIGIVLLLVAWFGANVLAGRVLAGAVPGIRAVLFQLGLQSLIWLLLGCCFSVLLPEFHGPAGSLVAAGAFSVAFGAGFLAFFAPAGIGVRELILASALLPFYNTSDVITMCILNRTIWVVIDFSLAGLVFLVSRLVQQGKISTGQKQSPSNDYLLSDDAN